MNAIDILIKEHERVRHVLIEIDDNNHPFETKQKKFDTLCHDLLRHEQMEHRVWYPRFKDNEKVDDTVRHLITEEKGAERAIKSFDNVRDEGEWDTKFSKFKRDVEHHASEEEHKLFPLIRRLLSESELEQIGKEMLEFKKEYETKH